MMPLLQSGGHIYSKYKTQTVEKTQALLIIIVENGGVK
jgi:hypothetical protein